MSNIKMIFVTTADKRRPKTMIVVERLKDIVCEKYLEIISFYILVIIFLLFIGLYITFCLFHLVLFVPVCHKIIKMY